MHLIRNIILFLSILSVQFADAQSIISGTVLDAETLEPVIGATIANAKLGKALTVTQTDGSFSIPKNNDVQLRITSIGYKPLVTAPTRDGRYLLHAEISQLGEVVVTAQENRGLTTSAAASTHR